MRESLPWSAAAALLLNSPAKTEVHDALELAGRMAGHSVRAPPLTCVQLYCGWGSNKARAGPDRTWTGTVAAQGESGRAAQVVCRRAIAPPYPAAMSAMSARHAAPTRPPDDFTRAVSRARAQAADKRRPVDRALTLWCAKIEHSMSDDDLHYGDVVRLIVCADAGATRIVRGEGHVLRNLTAVQPERRVGDDADYLFQVVPELEHKAAKSASPSVKRRLSQHQQIALASASFSGEEAGFDISKFLKAQEKEELLSNVQRLRALAEDHDAMSTVQFGEIIQLRHVQSGLFLTKVAHGLRLDLSEGDSSSCFRVMPRHLHNSEGDTVLIGEQLLLETPTYLAMYSA